ncbi:uncharacterized protein BXZ73DRAFT_96959 [Epithele typhae]|uniref:uncharacterized protein n=1 Tax=Epithele typhae TaxID=378194 RepID=UPI0020086C4F|nr:uncharacterized protein BXZ73DRAFT_96959 [Epithele typhae]KAH9944469.1 hypothetical protein BXZ73DRAFT_96959 [Epithele typhae]
MLGLASNPNRKSFSLSLNLSLSKPSLSAARPSIDPAPFPRPLPSPKRDTFRSPLLSPLMHRQDQPLLTVPVSDGLDPSERTKLLRKSRKLSRILGEVPVAVAVQDATDLHAQFASPPSSPSSSAFRLPIGHKGSLSRSATVAHNRLAQQKQIARARSLASLRPSLNLAFSRDERALPPLPPSPITPSAEGGGEPVRAAAPSASPSRPRAPGATPCSPTPHAVQRARAAKLTRQLGENVPPHVLFRASSPTLRHTRMARPHTAGAPETLRRRPGLLVDSDVEMDDVDIVDFDDDALLSPAERQRALNVRRARKMAQMFGNDVPPALFQITNFSTAASAPDRRRLRTAVHTETALAHDDWHPRNISPLIFANPDRELSSGEGTPDAMSDAEDAATDVGLPYLNSPTPRRWTCSCLPRSQSLSVGSSLSSHSRTRSLPPTRSLRSPPSAPARRNPRSLRRTTFATNLPLPSRGSISAPTSPPAPSSPGYAASTSEASSPVDFRTRRLRAAKLSRFFGVGLSDITGALVPPGSSASAPGSPGPDSASTGGAPPTPNRDKDVPPSPTRPRRPFSPSGASTRTFESGESGSAPASASSHSHAQAQRRPRKRTLSAGSRSQQGARRAQATSPRPPPLVTSELPRSPTSPSLPPLSPPLPLSSPSTAVVPRSPAPAPTPSPGPFQSLHSFEPVSPEGEARPASPMQVHGRSWSTTVEVAAESRSYFFRGERKSRREKGRSELEMHAAIKQLRKIK